VLTLVVLRRTLTSCWTINTTTKSRVFHNNRAVASDVMCCQWRHVWPMTSCVASDVVCCQWRPLMPVTSCMASGSISHAVTLPQYLSCVYSYFYTPPPPRWVNTLPVARRQSSNYLYFFCFLIFCNVNLRFPHVYTPSNICPYPPDFKFLEITLPVRNPWWLVVMPVTSCVVSTVTIARWPKG